MVRRFPGVIAAIGLALPAQAGVASFAVQCGLDGTAPSGASVWASCIVTADATGFRGELLLAQGHEPDPSGGVHVPIELGPGESWERTISFVPSPTDPAPVQAVMYDTNRVELERHRVPCDRGAPLGMAALVANGQRLQAWGRKGTLEASWSNPVAGVAERADAYDGYSAVLADLGYLQNHPAAAQDALWQHAAWGGTVVVGIGRNGAGLRTSGAPEAVLRAVDAGTDVLTGPAGEAWVAARLRGGTPFDAPIPGGATWVPLGAGRVLLTGLALDDLLQVPPETLGVGLPQALGLATESDGESAPDPATAASPQPVGPIQPQGLTEMKADGSALAEVASRFSGGNASGFMLLAGIMLLYVLLVGPIEYFWLRKRKKLHLTFVTYPLLVGGFTAGLAALAWVLRGPPMLAQVLVVDDRLQDGATRHSEIIALYPSRFLRDIELETAPGALSRVVKLDTPDFWGGARPASREDARATIRTEPGPPADRHVLDVAPWEPFQLLYRSTGPAFDPPELNESGANARFPVRGFEVKPGAAVAIMELGQENPAVTLWTVVRDGRALAVRRKVIPDAERLIANQITNPWQPETFPDGLHELLLSACSPLPIAAEQGEVANAPGPLRMDGAWIPGRPARLVVTFEPLEESPEPSVALSARLRAGWRVRRWIVAS